MALYKGYSSFEFQKNKTFNLTDVELVKLDLLSHIFTRRGERVAMSNFGTIIPDIVFEPLDEETVDIIDTEIRAVIDFDPRVRLTAIRVYPDYDNGAVHVEAVLFYIELDIVDNFELNIVFED